LANTRTARVVPVGRLLRFKSLPGKGSLSDAQTLRHLTTSCASLPCKEPHRVNCANLSRFCPAACSGRLRGSFRARIQRSRSRVVRLQAKQHLAAAHGRGLVGSWRARSILEEEVEVLRGTGLSITLTLEATELVFRVRRCRSRGLYAAGELSEPCCQRSGAREPLSEEGGQRVAALLSLEMLEAVQAQLWRQLEEPDYHPLRDHPRLQALLEK
jgi:hypothetical protein